MKTNINNINPFLTYEKIFSMVKNKLEVNNENFSFDKQLATPDSDAWMLLSDYAYNYYFSFFNDFKNNYYSNFIDSAFLKKLFEDFSLDDITNFIKTFFLSLTIFRLNSNISTRQAYFLFYHNNIKFCMSNPKYIIKLFPIISFNTEIINQIIISMPFLSKPFNTINIEEKNNYINFWNDLITTQKNISENFYNRHIEVILSNKEIARTFRNSSNFFNLNIKIQHKINKYIKE